MDPSALNLTLKTHLHPIGFLLGGKGVSCEVLVLIREDNLDWIAYFQLS